MIEATQTSVGATVVHPDWLGRPFFGTIVAVPNRFHVDVVSTTGGRVRMSQSGPIVWEQDYKSR